MPSTPARGHAHFDGLDGIRALAALAVLVSHLSLALGHDLAIGRNAVRAFFALSGFLITYLLRQEQADRGRIRLGAFYGRRILRIWPLYYLVIVIAVTLLPRLAPISNFPPLTKLLERTAVDRTPKLLLYVFFLPNAANVWYSPIAGASHLWSLGVEEQFYLIWPLLLSLPRRRHVLAISSLIVGKLLFFAVVSFTPSFPDRDAALDFLTDFSIEILAVGALAAIALADAPWLRRWIEHRATPFLLFVAVSASATSGSDHALKALADGFIYSALILYVCRGRARWLNARPLVELGKRSYGIYMLHVPILLVADVFVRRAIDAEARPVAQRVLLAAITLVATLALAWFSYAAIESRFLRLKRVFSAGA